MASSIDLPSYRRRVATLLVLLASDDSQTILSRRSDRGRIAYELARAWFDEVYLPSGRYLDGLKGDFSQEAAEHFRDAFDPVELAALERFHRFFELRIDMWPADMLDRRRIPIDERWHSLMRDAGYLLEDLGIDADTLRRRLYDDLRTSDGIADLIHIEA